MTEAHEIKAAHRKEASQAHSLLADLQAVQAVLQRDTEEARIRLDELKESQRHVQLEIHREQTERHNLKATRRRLEQEVDQEKQKVEDLRRTRQQLERDIDKVRDARERVTQGRERGQSLVRSPEGPAVHAARTNGGRSRDRPGVGSERRRCDGIPLERHRVGDGLHRGDVIRVHRRSPEEE
ncbi:hypothetical protein PV04_08660 [Phialophora macrospora]|uniref:Myosin tail domain-containing protein n=1 Tax=Phialophora macrospora TaxID=1851006 RepID=A0A0D2DMX8_9EURO|nr:hypothetical protein PV04_08660 [Phialophora macrospora]